MAGTEGFGSLAWIRNATPITQEPLRLLAQGFRHIPEPWPHNKAEVECTEGGDPTSNGVLTDPDLFGHGRVNQLIATLLSQQACHHRELVEILDAGHVADILAQQLVSA